MNALRIAATISLELGFNPIDRGSIAIRSLAAVAELCEVLDGRFVAFQIKAADHIYDRIGRGCCGVRRSGLLGPGQRRAKEQGG